MSMACRVTHTDGSLPLCRVLVCLVFVLAGCSTEPTGQKATDVDSDSLAQIHCASCHAYAAPDLLDRDTWLSSTLPVMGARLGIYDKESRSELIAPMLAQKQDPAGIFPEQPLLKDAEWQAIVDFYASAAPASLSQPDKDPVAVGLKQFSVQSPRLSFSPPLTTMVGVLEEFQAFFVANLADPSSLILLTHNGELLYQFEFPEAPVATIVDGTRLYVLTIGKSPSPSVEHNGAVYVIDDPSIGPVKLIGDLQRPVDIDLVDINTDGRKDLLICEYGHYTGALSWFEQTPDGEYIRHELHSGPGAIQAAFYDFDQDGLEDIGVLMAQGDERFDIYYQKPGNQFVAKKAIEFPPVNGSTSFSLADFDSDGRMDILYSNGDNADSSPIPKPYHGIHIYTGDATGSFAPKFFYPLHGAFKAEAADFDEDGDLDIAAIAYFPDYESRPEESFALLTNQGDFKFTASTFEDSYRGRWIAMDIGDIDGDEDQDILLGSNIGFGPTGDQSNLFERWERENISYIILENEVR